MAYYLELLVTVVLLTMNTSALTAISNDIQSYTIFSAIQHSVLRSIQNYLTQNTDLTLCTQIFINNNTDSLFKPEGMPSIITSSIPPLNQPTSSVLQHSSQCSVVSVVNAINIMDNCDENWLKYIPGTYFNSFHFILTPEEFLGWMWDRPFVRRLANVVAFVNRGEKPWDLVIPNRYNGKPPYFRVGNINEDIFSVTLARGIFWNKWSDMEGVELKVAVPPSMPEEQFRLQAQGKLFLYAVLEVMETVRYLNSTPKVMSMPMSFIKFPNGSWDGFIGNVMNDSVDITYPNYPYRELYAAVFISKPALCSQVKFFAPLPKKARFTLDFLTKPLDTAIWIALLLCIFASALVVYVLSNTDDPKFVHQLLLRKLLPHRLKRLLNISTYFVRMLLDQSLPSSVTKFLDQVVGSYWLFVAWFVTVTVIGSGYKSVVVSILVKPAEVYPPQTISELIKSDFTVNIPVYKISYRKGLSWEGELKHPIKDFGFDFRGCLGTLLRDNNVCLSLHHWLYMIAPRVLIDKSGNPLYLISKDASSFVANSIYISQRNPQLKAAVDRVLDAVIEGGLQAQWIRKSYYYNFLTTLRQQQKLLPPASYKSSETADINFMQYPMLVLVVGCLLASCCHTFLYLSQRYLNSEPEGFVKVIPCSSTKISLKFQD